MFLRVINKIRSITLKIKGASLADTIQARMAFFEGNPKNLFCGNSIYLEKNVLFRVKHNSKLNIGNKLYINNNTIIDCTNSITIGNNVMIGPNCYIGDFDHDIYDEKVYKKGIIVLGNNIWIGANCSILKNVTIGDNVIIGAGSVVSKNIPRNSIAVGNPAKVIKNI